MPMNNVPMATIIRTPANVPNGPRGCKENCRPRCHLNRAFSACLSIGHVSWGDAPGLNENAPLALRHSGSAKGAISSSAWGIAQVRMNADLTSAERATQFNGAETNGTL